MTVHLWGLTVRRLAALCAVVMTAVVLPVMGGVPASGATTLVTAHPDYQASDGDPVDITVAVITGATSTCTLTGSEGVIDVWTPCRAAYTFRIGTLGDGRFDLTAVVQKNGVTETAVSSFLFDTVVPEAVQTTRYPALVSGKFYTSWYVRKQELGELRFEVQQRLDSPFSGPHDWRTRAASTEKRSLDFVTDPGETMCVRVRATDEVGHTGPWSREICRTRPLDDRKLEGWRGSRKWDAISFSNNYQGTALITKSKGARVYLPTDRISELRIQGREGPYSGTIEIRIGDRVVDRVNLKARRAQRTMIFKDSFREPKRGRLTIEVISPNGAYVHLDMLIIRR